MTPTRTCPRCGRITQAAHSFCPTCGESFKTSSGGNGWKLLVGAFLLFAGALWAAAIYTQTRPTPPRPQLLAGAETAPSPAGRPAELTGAQHLAAAKKALADGYRPHKDPKKASWGEVATARWHLKEIGPAAVEYREAQELLKEVARRERQIELAAREKPPAPTPTPTPNADEDESERSETAAQAPSRPSTGAAKPTGGAGQRAGSGSSSDDYYTNVEGVRVRRPAFSESGPPPGASAQCRDGSYSFSRNRRGTCSHHGGVARWL